MSVRVCSEACCIYWAIRSYNQEYIYVANSGLHSVYISCMVLGTGPEEFQNHSSSVDFERISRYIAHSGVARVAGKSCATSSPNPPRVLLGKTVLCIAFVKSIHSVCVHVYMYRARWPWPRGWGRGYFHRAWVSGRSVVLRSGSGCFHLIGFRERNLQPEYHSKTLPMSL